MHVVQIVSVVFSSEDFLSIWKVTPAFVVILLFQLQDQILCIYPIVRPVFILAKTNLNDFNRTCSGIEEGKGTDWTTFLHISTQEKAL